MHSGPWDVIVIGGGPAGLYAAERIARRGISVLVLEEHPEIGEPVHCTGIVNAEVFELPGMPAGSVLAWHETARFHSPSGVSFGYTAPKERVCIVDRGAFDRSLAERARAAGVTVRTSAVALDLRVEPDGVQVDATIGDEVRTLRAAVCVLATGAKYRFQRTLGWGTPASTLAAAQTEAAAPGASDIELFFRTDTTPRGFAWVAPLLRNGEPRAKVGVMAPSVPSSALRRFLDDLARLGRVAGPPGPVVVRPLPLGPISRTYGNRVVAVGDAAGIVKPTTGGGIFYSLLSAGWAATAITDAFVAGDFSARALAVYEKTWRSHLGRELAIGAWLRRLTSHLTNRDIDLLSELAATDGVLPILRRTGRFNWHRAAVLALLRHPGVWQIVGRRLAAIAGLAPLHLLGGFGVW